MDFKNLVKLNLKSLQELKEKTTGADLETINKVMATVREKYRKKNGATKVKSGGSSGSSTQGSKNEDSQVWTAPSDTECRKTTTLNEAINLMKNYKPRQKLVPKTKKRPDPIEKTIHQDESKKMIEQYLEKNQQNIRVNEIKHVPLDKEVNPSFKDTRFEFLKDYDILSITFQVILK
jgi:hypothetical protein